MKKNNRIILTTICICCCVFILVQNLNPFIKQQIQPNGKTIKPFQLFKSDTTTKTVYVYDTIIQTITAYKPRIVDTIYRFVPIGIAPTVEDRILYSVDTAKNDSTALIVISDELSCEGVLNRSLVYQNRTPTQVNNTTVVNQYTAKFNVNVGIKTRVVPSFDAGFGATVGINDSWNGSLYVYPFTQGLEVGVEKCIFRKY